MQEIEPELSDSLSKKSSTKSRSVLESTPNPKGQASFRTVSLEEVNRLYSPADVSGIDFETDIGPPGKFPYTRGIHATGYRGKLWTMRQFAGFGTPEETNLRFKYL